MTFFPGFSVVVKAIFSFYFRMAITAPIAPLQTPVQKAHLKAIVNRCQKILFLFIFCFVVLISATA